MKLDWTTAAAALLLATTAHGMGRRPAKTAAQPAAENTMSVPVQEWKGQNDGDPEPGAKVVADAETWARTWKGFGKDAPAVDFAKFVVVVVNIGEKPTGGYTAVFDEPVARGDDLLVRYRVPKPSGFVTQAFTHPWKARAFPRPKGKVVVEAAP